MSARTVLPVIAVGWSVQTCQKFGPLVLQQNGNCPGSSAKSGLWPRQRPESQFFQRKFAYRPPLRGGTWAPSRGTWAVTDIVAFVKFQGQIDDFSHGKASTTHIRCAAVDAVGAVEDAGIRQQDFQQGNAATIRRIRMADATAGAGADPAVAPGIAFVATG